MPNTMEARRSNKFPSANMRRDEEKCSTHTSSSIVLCTYIVDRTTVVWWSPSSSSTTSAGTTTLAVFPTGPESVATSPFGSTGTADPTSTAGVSTRLHISDVDNTFVFPSTTSIVTATIPPPTTLLPSFTTSLIRKPQPSAPIPTSATGSPDTANTVSAPSAIGSTSTSSSISVAVLVSTRIPAETQQVNNTRNTPKPLYIPWPALGALIALIISIACISLWLYKERMMRRFGRAFRHHDDTSTTLAPAADPSSQTTSSLDETSEAYHHISTPQRPVSMGRDVSTSDIVSSRATRGSARSVSMYSHRTGVTEASRNALGRWSLAMAEWASLDPLSALTVQSSETVEGEAHVSEVLPRDDHPDVEFLALTANAESSWNEDSQMGGRGGEQGQEVQAMQENGIEQSDWSTRVTTYQRNMSISGGSISSSTMMIDPPPPYRASGEAFNPEEFDLSQVTSRLTNTDGLSHG